ncbi:hypothetical protein NQ315_008517 [Exocentrus adspersus]|uniref:small monomeric GTPase n=1 Tax=Exocentrus adspersus TaxID=1586481 RepID=A0AAV8W6B0_9CUCU|nr:hypothetical protein NQ315_008517 [Exocentrus adspersus]
MYAAKDKYRADWCKHFQEKNGCLYEHIRWGEAFVIVYSVVDRHSFHEAQEILGQLVKLKLPSYYTSLLLGNKRDLDHSSFMNISRLFAIRNGTFNRRINY